MLENLSQAGAALLLAVAQAFAPAPDLPISDWVDQGHIILTPRTNTPKPGPLSFEGIEYLREPVDRLHPDDPSTRVTLKGGAQSAKSTAGQIWVAWSIANNPKSFAIGLPSMGEVPKYNDLKLQPIIEDSPALAPRVRAVSTKADIGSSTRTKRLFNGATIRIFNLSSPKELQMISTGNLILEEVANTLDDVGGRGSAVKQARERQAAYSIIGSKELMVSTPGELGTCEVTKAYEAGDQRQFYGLCPHCKDNYFRLEPEDFKPATGSWGHHFLCGACGVPMQDGDRALWRRHGVWLPTFTSLEESNPAPGHDVLPSDVDRFRQRPTEGRQPSYYVWQAMCGLISLDKIAVSISEAKTPEEIKTLEQQTYGRAYDPAVEALSWEELHRLREKRDHGVVPAGCELLTGFSDVQGGYLQWAVYGWAPGAEWFRIDGGVILGDTAGDEVWKELDQVRQRRYPHEGGGELAIEAFGVDTGFRTQRVYQFVAGRPNCYALDGRADWNTPIFGKPKVVKRIQNGRKVGSIKLYPTGTWGLKSLLAWSLKVSIEAGYEVRHQGRGHWTEAEDESWCQEITAEVYCEEKNEKTGEMRRWWKKVRKNEETDIWVGARALAWNLGVGAPRRDKKPGEAIDWTARAIARGGNTDLFQTAALSISAPASQPEPHGGSTRRFFKRAK